MALVDQLSVRLGRASDAMAVSGYVLAMASRFSYSRWDGLQKGFDLDADQVMQELTDDLLYHGDVHAALRRMMQQGMKDRNGERVQGLREILERLRESRKDTLDKHNLGGVYDDIAKELREVVETEQAALKDRLEASDGGSPKDPSADSSSPEGTPSSEGSQQMTPDSLAERQFQLDLLPPDLAGQIKSLQAYDFVSPEAKQRFDELVTKLREQMMQNMVDKMTGAMAAQTREGMQAMKDMLSDLNQMLDAKARGEDPGFEAFMEKHGEFFPENPQSLDELLENMAQRMAAMQQMLNSMTPEQRAQMQQLSDQLMEDMDLRWQVDQLGQNLQSMYPQMGWDQRRDFRGQDPLGFGDAMQMMNDLGDLDQLEQLLRGATNPGALAEADIDRVRDLLGDETAESLQKLAELTKMLEDAGLINQKEGRLELTPRAIRKLGANALGELFSKLAKDKLGQHKMHQNGTGHERDFETKPYEWGDPFNLDLHRTIRNGLSRQGGGTPVKLTPEDFEIERTENLTKSATVLMLDLSLSMPMRDNFLPAKKVTLALHSLITSQFPRDYIGIVGFSEVGRILTAQQLPEVSWDFVYGTNMQHGMQLARQLLAKQTGTKQIIMITDGEPTAHVQADGHVFFNYPPVWETVEATLKEVARCTRDGITINTFMLDADRGLKTFVEKLTAMNRGRAFFTSPETLGDYVIVDFLEHKRSLGRTRKGA
jgi:uncharacterized protein with von Willebrand factor type A (vWA) domain